MIVKRDGTRVEFSQQKIINAINKAFEEVDGQVYSEEIAQDIAEEIYEEYTHYLSDWDIEKIQDLVEQKLMQSERLDVAKAYIIYREKRSIARNAKSALHKEIGKKLQAQDIKNQNANVDEKSFGGRNGEAASVMNKDYALNYLVSKKTKENHLNNRIYTHDLDQYVLGNHNCLTVPIDHLLEKGFNTRQTDVRPASSINTAFQLLAVIFQIQSLQQFGGVSCSHLDWSMVPYVRKSFVKHWKDGYKYIAGAAEDLDWDYLSTFSIDSKHFTEAFPKVYKYALDMTERELKQAVEGMLHNLNTLQSRSGNQLPFSSINYGTCTLVEGRMVTKAILEGTIEGLGKSHRTSVFPCQIFQYMKGVNDKPGTPNYDLYQLALKSTATRLYPNYCNVDWSGNAGYDPEDPRTYMSTMGCRTNNGWDINGFGQLKDGRGNICPVTIIMPTIAMEVYEIYKLTEDSPMKETYVVEAFMNALDNTIDEAKDILLERFNYICSQSPDSAKFMYENGLMAGYIPEEGIKSALKHGTLAIGQLGLAETLQILIGEDHTTEEGMKVAKQIEQLFKDKCAEFKEQYQLNFGVYYTPAENLCYTAMQKFKDKYGIIENVSDKEFFTNSMHVPVWKEMSPLDKIDIESQLTGYSSAGCITYVELDGTVKNNLAAVEQIVNYAMDKDIPYFAINVPNDTCLDCGYLDEFNKMCPECGSENIQQLRRVTGYLTGNYTTAFNKGKVQEAQMRVKHKF